MPEQLPIDRAFFRRTEGGVTVFFPWGLAHRGYELRDEAAEKRAARAGSLLIGSTIAIGTWTAYALQPLLESNENGLAETLRVLAAPGAALLFVFFLYALWASRFVEGLTMSDLRVSRDERLSEAAKHAEPWQIVLIGVVTCALSVLLIWLQPNAWWIGLLGVALGIGALYWSSLLKRAASHTLE